MLDNEKNIDSHSEDNASLNEKQRDAALMDTEQQENDYPVNTERENNDSSNEDTGNDDFVETEQENSDPVNEDAESDDSVATEQTDIDSLNEYFENNDFVEEQPENKFKLFLNGLRNAFAFVKKCIPTIVKILSYVIPIIIFLYVIGIVTYYITSAYRGEFHSDCTDTIMWANASVESGSVYDKDFSYACFLPFGINVIMQPLIMLFGLTMKAHIGGMMGYFILLIVFFCLMLKEMHWNIRAICLAGSLFLSMTLSTKKLREIFWQHTIYYTLGILFIVIGLYLYFHILNVSQKLHSISPGQRKRKRTILRLILTFVILSVFVMFTATDGISALSIFAVPFVGAIFAEFFVDNRNDIISKKALKTFLAIICFGVMIILGIKLNGKWMGDMVAGYQDANSIFSEMNTWTDHIHNFPFAWMKLNGVQDLSHIRLSSKEGIVNLLYMAASLIMLVMPIIATCFYAKFKDAKDARMLRISIWLHWASSAIVLIGYICGVLSAADWRLTPIMGTSLIISILFIHWAIASKTSIGRVAAVLSIPMIMVSIINLKTVSDIPKDYHKENNLYELAEFLEDNELTYGYATFWNANAITLISDSNVKTRDVNIDQNGVTQRIYQSSSNWYKDQEGQEKYFLLLSPPEHQTLIDIQSPLLDEYIEYLPVMVNNTEYRVLVFDYNFIPQ